MAAAAITAATNDNPKLFQSQNNITNAIAWNGVKTCTMYNTLKLA
jgi:hypothetical protein